MSILVLEIVGEHAGKFGADSRKVFKARGGTIGRAPACDWQIADPHVSGRHVQIKYVDHIFLLIDTSTNGVWVNSNEERLAPGEHYELVSGDRLFIDNYEIRVTILDDDGLGSAPVSQTWARPFEDVTEHDPPPPLPRVKQEFAAPAITGETDPLRALTVARRAEDASYASLVRPLRIPRDYDPLDD